MEKAFARNVLTDESLRVIVFHVEAAIQHHAGIQRGSPEGCVGDVVAIDEKVDVTVETSVAAGHRTEDESGLDPRYFRERSPQEERNRVRSHEPLDRAPLGRVPGTNVNDAAAFPFPTNEPHRVQPPQLGMQRPFADSGQALQRADMVARLGVRDEVREQASPRF